MESAPLPLFGQATGNPMAKYTLKLQVILAVIAIGWDKFSCHNENKLSGHHLSGMASQVTVW
jgi:hypothetical protein